MSLLTRNAIPDEAARRFAGAWSRRSGQLSLDDAVPELEPLDDGHFLLTGGGDLEPFLAIQCGRLGRETLHANAGRRFQRELLDLGFTCQR